MLKIVRRINTLLEVAGDRARAPCLGNKGRPSSTPRDRWINILHEEVAKGAGKGDMQVLGDLELLLTSLAEKRRLTIDWRGGMMTNAELIKATAKRVGLVAPELWSDNNKKSR